MPLYIPVIVSVFSFVIVTFVLCRRLQLKTNYFSRHLMRGPTPPLEMNGWHWFIYAYLCVCLVIAPSAFIWLIWLG